MAFRAKIRVLHCPIVLCPRRVAFPSVQNVPTINHKLNRLFLDVLVRINLQSQTRQRILQVTIPIAIYLV